MSDINIGQITEALNDKADRNAANLDNSGKSLISALALPSSTRYDNLTMGASGTSYTAPANGYFVWWKTANGSNQYCGMSNNVTGVQCFTWTPVNGGGCQGFLPAQKGDECYLGYNAGGAANLFRFVYTKGDENV